MADSPDNAGKPQVPSEAGLPSGGNSEGKPASAAGPWVYSGIPEHYSATPASGAAPAQPAAAAGRPVEITTAKPPVAKPIVPPAPPPSTKAATVNAAKVLEKKQTDASLASVVDTIEAIIIALIIALTFRAFVVEAFVIPTGSMAPTLLGAHFKANCPKCGYEFDYNATVGNQVQGSKGSEFVPERSDRAAELRSNSKVPLIPEQGDNIFCPNCRYLIPPTELPQYLGVRRLPAGGPNGGPKDYHFPWANNGDRILVLKYLYAVKEPQRWDVIVFKEPQAADSNYIKRLVGLPHETVQIINGDIYAGTGAAANPRDRKIQRKPEEIQKALWQLVYDNDYYPRDEGKTIVGSPVPLPHYQEGWTNPWEAQPAEAAPDWKKGTTMQYTGVVPGSLQFNLTPSKLPDYPPYTLNTLGYNGDFFIDDTSGAEGNTPRSIVGDLRLEALWTPGAGEAGKAASIMLTLGRPNNCYQFAWDAGGMKLLRRDAKASFLEVPAEISRPQTAPERGRAYHLAFNNVDHAVQVYINGNKVLTYQEEWNAELAAADVEAHKPDWANSRGNPLDAQEYRKHANSIIRIDVDGACALSHLKLYRDLYYTQVAGGQGTGTLENPLQLKQDEFFALGDNSRKSLDGRMWGQTYEPLGDLELSVGIVPRRYLLGKAFFVYWPAGYRASDKIGVLKDLPLVPNTGNMRIIR